MGRSSTSTEALPEGLASNLWKSFAQMFGAARLERELGATAPELWRRGLAGLSGEDLARGLRRLVHGGAVFLPTLGEFRTMCQPTPEELGLPSEAEAYQAACSANWRLHPAVWHAAKAVGVYALRHDAEVKTRPAFAKAWAMVVDQVRAGAAFDLPEQDAPRLEDKRTKADRVASMRKHIGALKAALNGDGNGNTGAVA